MRKLLYLLLLAPVVTFSQNDLLDEIDTTTKDNTKNYATAAFKGLKIVNFESTKLVAKKELNFIVAHRFGNLKNGVDTFFGLDEAVTRLNFVYGLTDGINIGVSRSSFLKIYEASLKYRLARQVEGGFPLTIVGFNAILANTSLRNDDFPGIDFSNKLGYTSQLLISRKVNTNLSLQVAPTVIHEGLVDARTDNNTQAAIGIGGRYKLTKRWSINVDYGALINKDSASPLKNPLSIGFDLETGGHVFQLHFTNARGINTNSFIGRTTEDWLDGGIFFGFNLGRTF